MNLTGLCMIKLINIIAPQSMKFIQNVNLKALILLAPNMSYMWHICYCKILLNCLNNLYVNSLGEFGFSSVKLLCVITCFILIIKQLN